MIEIGLEMLVALGRLRPRQREVVIDRVVVGMTLQAIADRDGVSRSAVHQLERAGLAKLKRELKALTYER